MILIVTHTVTTGPTLGTTNITHTVMQDLYWASEMLHRIAITLCLRYTEVDQTFGWARLSMDLKAYHVLGEGYLRQRLTNHKVEVLLSLLKHLFIQYINIDSFIQK